MAEIIGTTIGVVGFLGQLFDGCVKAYGYFTTASHLDTDSQRMQCKVRIEEMRLVVWGREWGVAEGKLEAHLDMERNPQLRHLATQILQELHSTVTDFKKLQDRYGLGAGASDDKTSKKQKEGIPSTAWTKDGNSLSGSKNGNGNGNTDRGWKKELSLRTRWVIQDKEKFLNLLRDLKDFNDGLERLFPAWQLASFQRAWTHRLLETAQRDLTQLSLLETASSDTYPQLHASANLKKLRINLDSKPAAAFKPTFALKVHRDALEVADSPEPRTQPTETKNDLKSGLTKSNSDLSKSNGSSNSNGNGNGTSNRCTGRHNRYGDVVIEWITYDREAIEERVAHVKRLDDLANMMHCASEHHPDLHSIDCVGYTDDSPNSRYGLVYNAPQPTFSTLHALIASPDLKTPDLNDRISLATTLAVSLWSLHSLDWLHKSLCAANILFFPSAFSSSAQSSTASAALVPDISAPFLAGFDASRPDLDIALSVAPRNPSISHLHRHPASLRGGRPHCKSFDIYSLGLVLLEIGLWKVLQTYHKQHYSPERWRDRVVLAVLVPGLGSKVGRRYKEVVEMCLTADPNMDGGEAGKIMERVVTTLESIRI